MTSKILAEFIKVTGFEQEKGESDQAYWKALAKKLNQLDDATFTAMSAPAQDWFNLMADAVEANEDIKNFPDAQEETSRRRRNVEDDADKKTSAYEPKKGDKINITTKRGKEIKSVEFVEIEDGKLIVYRDNEGLADTPFDGAVMTSAEVPKEETSRRRSVSDDEPKGPVDPKVGDTLEVTNKRGKIYVGVLKEDTEDAIVLKLVDDTLEDIDKSRIEKIVIKHSPKADNAKTDDKPSGRRSAAKDDGEKKKTTKDDNGGEAISAIVAGYVLDDLDATDDDIQKKMTKNGVVFRDVTATLNYKQTHKLIAQMRERKMLK